MKMLFACGFAAALLITPQARADGQLRDANRYCNPSAADDPELIIGSCLKAIDSNLLGRNELSEAWNNVGGAHLLLKQYDQAVPALDKAIEADPKKWKAYVNRAIAEASLREPGPAETDLNTAVQLAPNESGPIRTRGQLYLGEGKLDQAIADLSAAIQIDSDDARAYGFRAMAYRKIAKPDLAAADIAQLQRLDPDDKFGLMPKNPPAP
jgi:tetratricopeptide (TPR) repeat protein